MAGHVVNMRNELEMFWWALWPVAGIPGPGEQGDPEHYAVLACIPTLLVESFNERIEHGLRREEPHSILSIEEQLAWTATPKKFESEPEWTRRVPPLKEMLHIPEDEPGRDEVALLEDPDVCLAFEKKNILMRNPHIHFM